MDIKFEETGEVRPPKYGEHFKGSDGAIKVAEFDFSEQSFPIMKMIVIEG